MLRFKLRIKHFNSLKIVELERALNVIIIIMPRQTFSIVYHQLEKGVIKVKQSSLISLSLFLTMSSSHRVAIHYDLFNPFANFTLFHIVAINSLPQETTFY